MTAIAAAEAPPEQVIAWLRSEEGEQWLSSRRGQIYRHGAQSGVLGEVCAPPSGGSHWCQWPDPYPGDEIDD